MQAACKRCLTASREEGTAPLQQMRPGCAAGPGWQGSWQQILARRQPAGEPCAGRRAWALAPARPRPLCSTKPISACRPSTGPSSDKILPCNEWQALLCASARPCQPCAPSCYLTHDGQCFAILRGLSRYRCKASSSILGYIDCEPELAHALRSVHTRLCSKADGLGSCVGLPRGPFWRCSTRPFSLAHQAAASQWLLECDRPRSWKGCASVDQNFGPRKGCLSHNIRACIQMDSSTR